MFKVGDIVEITEKSSATGMLDFVDGKGYAVLNVGFSSVGLMHIKLADESGRKFWHATSHFKLKEEAKMEKKECLFKKGQVVWDLIEGKGAVEHISGDETYPVKVRYEDGEFNYYTTEGKLHVIDKRPRLYFSEPKIEAATEPLFEPVLKQGDVVIAVNNDGWSAALNVKQELEEKVRNDQGTYFHKEAFTFYRVGEKIEFN